MYKVSKNFHDAVFSDNPEERIFIEFDNFFLNNEDVGENGGLRLTDNFNMDEEMTAGGTPSSVLDLSLFNDNNYLNRYSFEEEFSPRLGVKIGSFAYCPKSAYTPNNYVWCKVSPNIEVVSELGSRTVWFRGNGIQRRLLNPLPSKNTLAFWSHDDALYCIHADGTATRYFWDGITDYTIDNDYITPQIMIDKWIIWANNYRSVSLYEGLMQEFIHINDVVIHEWSYVSATTWGSHNEEKWEDYCDFYSIVWEYVPLGVFKATRPNRTKNTLIELNAQDRMSKFDVDITTWWNTLSYPIALQDIYDNLCAYIGVPTTAKLINGNIVYNDSPIKEDEINGQEVLQKIAEANGAIAKFDRKGNLVLRWFKTASFDAPWWYSQEVTEYLVQRVELLEIKNAANGFDISYGSGSNVYTILDNPFLVGKTSILNGCANIIYNILQSPNGYNPENTTLAADWSVEAGDIVTVNEYSFPIFVQTITWNGGAIAVYECSGEETRPMLREAERQMYNNQQVLNEKDVVTEGLRLAYLNGKTLFNNNGLTIYDNGFHMINRSQNQSVFEIDGDGLIELLGSVGKWKSLSLTNDPYLDDKRVGIQMGESIYTKSGTQYSSWEINLFNNMSGSDTSRISLKAAPFSGDIYADNYYNNSSRRYKKNIYDMPLKQAEKFYDLNFVQYEYNDGREGIKYGLIAEDVDADMGIVAYDKEGRPDSIDYVKLIPYIGKVVQEQAKKIKELEMRLNEYTDIT